MREEKAEKDREQQQPSKKPVDTGKPARPEPLGDVDQPAKNPPPPPPSGGGGGGGD